MSYLVQHVESGRKASLRMYGGRTLRIGRGTNNTLRLDNPGVELEHAWIRQDREGFVLRDLSKLRGTWVNDQRLQGEHRLARGDRVTIATFNLEVDFREPGSPLILLVGRVEDTLDETTVVSSRGLRGLIPRDPGSELALDEATMPTVLSRDLVALAEMEMARERARAGATAAVGDETRPAPADAPREDAADLETRPAPQESAAARLPTAGPPAAGPPAAGPPATDPAAIAPAALPRAPRVDYARAYGLRRGVLHVSLISLAFALIAAGTLFAIVRGGRWSAFSPGALAPGHRHLDATCGSCHSGWQRVEDPACRECHQKVGDHQMAQLAAPACADCHAEHRGGDALRFAAQGACVDCHGDLGREVLGRSLFAAEVSDFAPGEHPEFRLEVELDGVSRRLPLSDAEARGGDRGGLQGFDHLWHLERLPAHVEKLECRSCHRIGEDDGEIVPILFEEICQRCHNLVFDPRFAKAGVAEEAPHAVPAEILTHLGGRYVLRPDLLRRLDGGERRRLAQRRLSEEQQLRELAVLNAGRLLRNRCPTCHVFDPDLLARTRRDTWRREQIEALEVRPTEIPERWFEHAEFRHAAHLELDLTCETCHQDAAASRDTSDVLVPAIGVCFECHRHAQAGDDRARLGRSACESCHRYHPVAGEETFVPVVAATLPSPDVQSRRF